MARNADPTRPPEAELLQRARESRRPRKLSMREAAVRANVSETTWRHTEAGSEPRGDMRFPYRAGSATLARMAAVVGVTPDRLTAAGRDDAAVILREMLLEVPADRDLAYADPALQDVWDKSQGLPDEARKGLIRLFEDMRRKADQERGA